MTHIGRNLRALWDEAMTPSDRHESPYTFVIIAIGHAMLGATLSFGGLIVAIAYWIFKERGDLKRGGAWRDGVIDTAFVSLGLLYEGPWWWPATVLFTAILSAVVRGPFPTTDYIPRTKGS